MDSRIVSRLGQHWQQEISYQETKAAREKRLELGAPERVGGEDGPESWTCPACGMKVPEDSTESVGADGAPAIPVRCKCIAEAAREAGARVLEEAISDEVARRWLEAGIPARYADKTLDGFLEREGAKEALAACRTYAEAFWPGDTEHGLVLTGTWGAGKTHLAAATARSIVERTLARCRFADATELVDAVKPEGNGGGFRWGTVRDVVKVDLLILDDLGQTATTAFARDVLYRVVHERYNRKRPTLITTNLGDQQLAEQLGEALVSRLYESARHIHIAASDYRAEMAGRA